MRNKFYPSIHPLLSTSSVIKSQSQRTTLDIKSRSRRVHAISTSFPDLAVIKLGLFVTKHVVSRPENNASPMRDSLSLSRARVMCRSVVGVLLGERSLAIVKQPTDLLKKCRTPDIQSQQHMDGRTKTERRQKRPERGGSFMVDGQTIRCPRCRAIKAHRQGLMQPDGPLSRRLQCEFPSIVYANAHARCY